MNYVFLLLLAVIPSLGCHKDAAQSSGAAATPAQAGSQAAPPASPAQPAPATTAAPAAPVSAELPAVVARVNGEDVGRAELEEAIRGLEARAGRQIPADRRSEMYRSVLDKVISFKLLVQESKARSIVVPPAEIDAEIAKMKSQFPNEAAFTQALTAQGMTMETLRESARTSMAVTKLLDAEIGSKISVQPQEVQSFYDQNKDQFKQGEAVRASHILISAPQSADEAAKKKAREQADEILKQLKAGADFAALAKQHSQDPGSAVKGGDLGFFQKGMMVGPFENAAFALKPGEMSGVVESPFGYHIIKAVDRQEARTLGFDEVKTRINQYLVQQQQQTKTESYVAGLKAKGKIEILI